MNAIVLTGAFGLDNLKWTERALPALAAHEVRVRLTASSLNYRDLLMVTGLYNPKQPIPFVPGSDGVGVIEAIGEAAHALRPELRVGARVAGCFAPDWEDGEPSLDRLRVTLGGPRDGTFASHVDLPASGVVLLPDGISDAQAATLPCAALTAWNALVELNTLRASDTVLVQGTGGVSLFALQIARMHGAQVIVTSSSDEKLARARALGATHTINYSADPSWGKTAKKLTGGRGVDVVVEVGGAGTLEQSLRAVRVGGHVMLIGVLSGVAAQVSMTQILMQSVRVQGLVVGHRRMFERMLEAFSRHGLAPVIDRRFALRDAAQAFAHLQAGAHFGKIVLEH